VIVTVDQGVDVPHVVAGAPPLHAERVVAATTLRVRMTDASVITIVENAVIARVVQMIGQLL
jgi:hypothetical protein